jgi:hypothetical protein
MRKILERCPSCEGDLIVTQMSCTRCETVVGGRFQPTIFAKLSPENLRFVEAFVLSKGNIKEMERELGISYWTIRNQLNEIIETLGGITPPADPGDLKASRQEVLAQLESGNITVQEAASLLAQLRD